MRYRHFAVILTDALAIAEVEPRSAAELLGYSSPGMVMMWMEGKHLPPLESLPEVASISGADPRMLLAGWLIDSAPSLQPHVHDMIKGLGLDASGFSG
ncbi:MAG: hypothetical protein Q7V15_05270 [Phenylobacterium sp.]|uniref:hypothetical protein n=1 Tax=Phenylobacterium sp. TaxID=1871053 RepID=UPI0027158B17|nr:hypothetical protein [Phenylobacterium sp.]MDO8900747.1 hypothetical protein [Phenylobacterium sp.]